MHFNQSSSPPDHENNFKTGVNLFYLILSGYSTAFTVFLRHGFGGEAFGFNALATIVILLFFMMKYPESQGLVGYFSLWWGALFLQRLGHFGRRLRGILVHSRFEGVSWWETFLPFINYPIARALEVTTCILIGIAITPDDQGLGRFFLYGSGTLFLKLLVDNHIDHLQVRRLNDAAIEHQARVARWRSGRF